MKIFTKRNRQAIEYTESKGKLDIRDAANGVIYNSSGGGEMTIKAVTLTETPNTAGLTHTGTVAVLPAGSIVLGVVCRVMSDVLASSNTWSIGVSGATTKWGTTLARTAGTTATSSAFLAGASPYYTGSSATGLVFTSSSGNWSAGAGGSIKCTIYYASMTAPTA